LEELKSLVPILGFISSLILSYPAWRASVLLKEAHLLYKMDKGSDEATKRASRALSEAFERKANSWTPGLHLALIVGLLLMIASGFFDVWISLTGN